MFGRHIAALVALAAAGSTLPALAGAADGHRAAAAHQVIIDGAKLTPLASTLVTESGKPITFPGGRAQVVAQLAYLPVGNRLPIHKHPSNRYTYLIAGKLRVHYLDRAQVTDYLPGSFVVEGVGEWHFGESIGTEPVQMLVIDEVEAGRSNMVLREPMPQ